MSVHIYADEDDKVHVRCSETEFAIRIGAEQVIYAPRDVAERLRDALTSALADDGGDTDPRTYGGTDVSR